MESLHAFIELFERLIVNLRWMPNLRPVSNAETVLVPFPTLPWRQQYLCLGFCHLLWCISLVPPD